MNGTTALGVDWFDSVCVLSLIPNPLKPRGGVVVLDSWLIAETAGALESIAAQSPKGLVLRSASERVFIAGADLGEIDGLGDGALQRYLDFGAQAFARIYQLPCATVAIIHKAALGGGLELAMHCDGIVGVLPAATEKPWRIGLPECGLGICPGWGGTNMLAARIDPATAIKATASGETWLAHDAPSGLFDTVIRADLSNGDEVSSSPRGAYEAALDWLRAHPRHEPRTHPRTIDAHNQAAVQIALESVEAELPSTAAASAVVAAVRAGVANGWNAALRVETSRLIELRHTTAARGKLEAFLKPQVPKPSGA
ncbi:MAG: enoyl-CoA hydratase/isomerase family protein [Phycisphaerales bacterium]|nr:enoyl-CoA hydratase/isomerase family protein [Phycisphaerales bacterium]